MSDLRPAFEVITQDTHFKIWANGKVEGFGHGGRQTVVINRIPVLIEEARSEGYADGREPSPHERQLLDTRD